MNNTEFKDKLKKTFQDNKIGEISDEAADKLQAFAETLTETNKKFNLTSITSEDEIILKHFVDCAAVAALIPQGASVVDVGCGAGFPSLPIAILRQDVSVTALDSTAKKINFITETAALLGLRNITAISSRAEDFAKSNREKFDISISRAVARMNILDELCIPLTKIGGYFIAMKSSKGEEEYLEAANGIKTLGGTLCERQVYSFSLDSSKIDREIYIIQKISSTPLQYPRNYSQIAKKPL